jgi:cell division protein FtsB
MMRAMPRHAARRSKPGPPVRRLRSIVALAICLSGLVLAAAFVGVTVQANSLAREISALHADIAAAQADGAALRQAIANQRTDDYVVQKARDYGFIGANESLYAVQRNEAVSAQVSASAKVGPSRWERWIAFFFGAR